MNQRMETIIAAGGDATGSSGTATYSIGQIFYTYNGLSSIYNVAQGIQHEEFDKAPIKPEIVKPLLEISIFPNPTSDFVNLNMKGVELANGQQSYQLYDIQGRLLKQGIIDQNEIQVSLNNLRRSIYILRIYDNKEVVKTFKILKR